MKRITTILLALLLVLAPMSASFMAKAANGSQSGSGEVVELTEDQAATLEEKGYLTTDSARAQITITEDEYRLRARLTKASEIIRTGDASILSLAKTVSDTGMYKDNYAEGTWQRQFYDGIEAAVLDGSLTYATPSVTVRITAGNLSASELWNVATEHLAYYNIVHAVVNDYMGWFNWAENTFGLSVVDSGGTCLVANFYPSGYYKASMEASAEKKISEAVTYALAGNTRYEQVKNVYYWLCDNCEYDYDALTVAGKTEDFFFAHSQLGLLLRGKGVCETYAKTAKIIFSQLGIPCTIVSSDSHAFNYVKMEDGRWYLFDATWADQSWGVYEAYLLSANNPAIDESHTEDDMHIYPTASASDYSPIGSCSHTGTYSVETERKEATYTAAGYVIYREICKRCGGVVSHKKTTLAKKQLDTPTNLKTANSSEGVTVSWSACSGATLYRVYRKELSVSGGTYAGLGNTSSVSFVDKTAVSGKKYAYTVRCLDSDGKTAISGYNAEGSQILYLKMPIVTLSNASAGVKVSFTSVGGASGYYIYRKPAGGSYERIATVTGTSYVDKTAVSGTEYVYCARAYNGSTRSHFTGVNIIYLTAILENNLTLSNVSDGVKAAWSQVSGASGYYVYRKTVSGSYARIATVTGTSYVDTTAVSGTTYTYCVRAYKSTYRGGYAGRDILYLSAILSNNLTLANTSTGVKVNWTKVAGASGYYVYRKTGSGSYARIKDITDGSLSYTDASIAANNGTGYTYCVRAYKDKTLGSYAGKAIYRLSATTISSISNISGRKITLSWAKNATASGYQIQYSTNSSFASGNTALTVSGASVLTKTTAALTSGATYYVRVRVYKKDSAGNNYYSAWSAVKSVKITK